MKKVSLIITVPEGDYCWKFATMESPCQFLNLEGGNSCDIAMFSGQDEDENGIVKSPGCAKLEIISEVE